MLDDYSTTYQLDFGLNFEEWCINFAQPNRTWNVATVDPRHFINTDYMRAASEAECKTLLKTWVNTRFETLHTLFNGEGSTDWPAPRAYNPYPGNNRALICVKENNKLVMKPLDIYGMVRATLGEEVSSNVVARLVYDLQDQTRKHWIKIELCTGGEFDEDLGGYKNWFPGATTYGLNKTADISLFADEDLTQRVLDANDNPVVIPVWSREVTKEEATFIILNVLDAVNTDPAWIARLKIKYHVRTHDGYEGYISAQNIIDIYYKVAD